MVHEEWFGEAMAEQPDLFILSGHMVLFGSHRQLGQS